MDVNLESFALHLPEYLVARHGSQSDDWTFSETKRFLSGCIKIRMGRCLSIELAVTHCSSWQRFAWQQYRYKGTVAGEVRFLSCRSLSARHCWIHSSGKERSCVGCAVPCLIKKERDHEKKIYFKSKSDCAAILTNLSPGCSVCRTYLSFDLAFVCLSIPPILAPSPPLRRPRIRLVRLGKIEGRNRQLESDRVAVGEGWPCDWAIKPEGLISLVWRCSLAAAEIPTVLSILSAEYR